MAPRGAWGAVRSGAHGGPLSDDDPRAHATPQALFGAAVGDLRSLKRAYAGLIRRWTPEHEPDAFRHIRDLYEAAVRHLERARDEVVVAVVDPQAEALWVDDQLSHATEDRFDGLLAALRARALDGGSAPSGRAWWGLLAAARPEEVLVALQESVVRPALRSEALTFANRLLWALPAFALAPGWAPVLASLPEPMRVELLTEIILATSDSPDLAGWRLWDEHEAELYRLNPGRWYAVTSQVVQHAAGTPREVLERWIERFTSARYWLEDSEADKLIRWTCDALAWTPEAPPFVGLLTGGHVSEPALLAPALRVFAELPDWRQQLARLASHNPTLASLPARAVELCSQRERTLWRWAVHGTPRLSPTEAAECGDLLAVVLSHAQARWRVYEVEQARKAQAVAALQAREWWRNVGLSVLAALVVLAGSLVGGGGGPRALAGVVIVGLIWRETLRYEAEQAASERLAVPTSERPDATQLEEFREAVLRHCREHGRWIHEVAPAVTTTSYLRVIDELLTDPLSDLLVITDLHIRRLTRATA